MKFLVYADPHFCSSSSIVRGRGECYSIRLENEIKSISWAEHLANELQCLAIICLGDFFDKSQLNAEELTSLKEIYWSNLPHYFLVGNHEISSGDTSKSSSHLLSLVPNITIIDKPFSKKFSEAGDLDIAFLPYITERERKPLNEYLVPWEKRKRIIFSHNDIKGVIYGNIPSQDGFSLDEINDNCALYINGHIHNCGVISQIGCDVYNIGNLTGINFSEDATKYRHCAAVIDTDNFKVSFIENPFAFNFYKFDFTERLDLDALNLNCTSVITVKCWSDDVVFVKEKINQNPKIIESRVISVSKIKDVDPEETSSLTSVDHIAQFKNYIVEQLGSTEIVLKELAEISK